MTKAGIATLNVVVEGQTEEEFVGKQLREHLATFNVFVYARRVLTSRHGATFYRGGTTNYARAEKDIRNWLSQRGDAYVTTFFDLYGLPTDFPGHADSRRHQSGAMRAEVIEQALAASIGHHRFIPFIQPHEFEALLFTDIEVIDRGLALTNPGSRLAHLRREIGGTTPEDLNDSPQTAPSKRLLRLGYEKTFHGPLIASEIGLPAIRAACPHFAAWLSQLEKLAR